jgi:hypothetical protein
MQMQDNVIGSTTNDATFGSLGSIGSTGLYEVAQLSSVTRAGSITQVTLTNALQNTYQTGANSSIQIITYPQMGSPDYTTTGSLTALAWNGEIGGVLAFRVLGVFTLAHNIGVNNLGFRGGSPNATADGSGCDATIFFSSTANHGLKGEGIYRNTDVNYQRSIGKLLTGGGGGSLHNAGGGGGGNYTSGGDGGPGWNGSASGCSPSAGGQGGVGLSTSYPTDGSRIFMGGGGGGGQQNNAVATTGGRGGGIILIRAFELRTVGACGTLSITSNGETISLAGNDGGGGGGAGGSIVLQVNSWNISPTCPILVSSSGGTGGSVNSGTHGGGGGGGQGTVFYSITRPTTNTTTQTTNGSGGCNNNSSPCDSQAPNGGGVSNAGIFDATSSPLPVDLVYFQAKKVQDKVLISWGIQNMNVVSFEIEKAVETAQSFQKIKKIESKLNTGLQNHEITDVLLNAKTVYYRLKVYYKNGKSEYSKIISVNNEQRDQLSVKLYPNPFQNLVLVEIPFIQKIIMTDISGKTIYEKECNSTNQEELFLGKINRGTYFLIIQTSTFIYREKIVKIE